MKYAGLNLVWAVILWAVSSQVVLGARSLSLSSLVTCMDNSQLDAQQFEVEFDPDDGSLHYNLNMNSEIEGNVLADVYVYAYGFLIIREQVNFCDVGWRQFCPLYPGNININSVEYIDNSLVSEIPGIAFTVPDIDAVARIIVRYYNGTEVACIQASFSNGKTVSHTAAKWVTAVVAGLGLLASAMLSAFGNSNSASHISANAMSLFLYFQSVVIVSMEHVQEVPPIAAAWAENLSWSMGLIRTQFMQDIFRWYVQSTGGTPLTNLTSETISILVQRSFNKFKRAIGMQYVEDLMKRDAPIYGLEGNNYLLIFRGIDRVAYKAGIEITSVCCTGFTFFVLCAYVLIGAFLIFKSSLLFLSKMGWINPHTAGDFRKNWRNILKGVLQRYIYIGFTQLIILSFWQFIQRDSPAVIVLLCVFLIFSLGIMLWACYRTLTFGRLSIKLHQNPALILYGDGHVLSKYGWFYTMFRLQRYWWGSIQLVHTLVKLIFIAFAVNSGKTQAMALFIMDLLYVSWLIYEKPYLDRPTNIINILINVVVTINSFLFTFFSNLYGQSAPVASIMGWIFFVLNAAFSLILLFLILIYAGIAIFSKNPDARFHPAKDDRTSFQNNKKLSASDEKQLIDDNSNELFALGITLKDHHENWAGEMYKLHDLTKSGSSSKTETGETTVDQSFGSKLVNKLTRGKSLNRTKSLLKRSKSGKKDLSDTTLEPENPDLVNVRRVSDTLLSPPPTATAINPAFHQRTESKTPMIQQQSGFHDDAVSVSSPGLSNYDEEAVGNSTGDFNYQNLTSGQPYKFHDSPRKSLSASISNSENLQNAESGNFDYH